MTKKSGPVFRSLFTAALTNHADNLSALYTDLSADFEI